MHFANGLAQAGVIGIGVAVQRMHRALERFLGLAGGAKGVFVGRQFHRIRHTCHMRLATLIQGDVKDTGLGADRVVHSVLHLPMRSSGEGAALPVATCPKPIPDNTASVPAISTWPSANPSAPSASPTPQKSDAQRPTRKVRSPRPLGLCRARRFQKTASADQSRRWRRSRR